MKFISLFGEMKVKKTMEYEAVSKVWMIISKISQK